MRKILGYLWEHISSIRLLSVQRVGLFMGILALVTGMVGYRTQHPGPFRLEYFVGDFYANISSELASIAITILIIDRLIQLRDSEKELVRLKRLMGSRTNSVAVGAVGLLRARGWLFDGSLEGINLDGTNLQGAALYDANIPGVSWVGADLREVDLTRANLIGAVCSDAKFDDAKLYNVVLRDSVLKQATFRNAFLNGSDLKNSDLTKADLEGARLYTCNLHGTSFRHANLQRTYLNEVDFSEADFSGANLYKVFHVDFARLEKASKLRGAIMPDGTRYDGRFSLLGDIQDAQIEGINVNDQIAMAKFYRVTGQ